MTEVLTLPVSYGDAIDRLTILEIKKARIHDPERQMNVTVELELISPMIERAVAKSPMLAELRARLRTVNERLWVIEDDIRECEQHGNFGDTFVQLARSVYRENDERARIKREINLLLGSPLVEEKSYSGARSS